MEFKMYAVSWALNAWLLEAAFHDSTAWFMPTEYRRLAYSRALSVSAELRTTLPSLSWMEPPWHQRMLRTAMFESMSWERPMPIGICIWGAAFLISGPALTRSSQVEGPLGIPMSVHTFLWKLPGS